MKKVKYIILTLIIVCMASQTAFASEIQVRLNGKTNITDAGVTVLVLKPNKDLSGLNAEDILYINQGEITADGTYSLSFSLNVESSTGLNLLSNVGNSFVSSDNAPKTLYVSAASGSDTNSGSETEPLASLGAAFNKAFDGTKIMLLTDYELPTNLPLYDGTIELCGVSKSIALTLPSKTTVLSGGIKIDNVTLIAQEASEIFANGYSLTIGEGVTTDANLANDKRLNVYGGGNGKTVASTNVTLLGGQYYRIHGGGKGAAVTGDTHVVVGGNVNAGDGIDDSKNTISPCYAFGGGRDGAVGGKTNLTLKDNAVVKYLVGGGANGDAPDTNIFIKGGKVMNVYGGFVNGGEKTSNTHITMTGGLAEALFGGNESANLKGNTYLTLLGGEVSRRVITGCYNEYAIFDGWKSNHSVIGTTNLTVTPDVQLATGKDIADIDIGVYVGSRHGRETAEMLTTEKNTIIFADNSYDKYKDKVKTGLIHSNPHYIIDAGEGGEVLPTETAGTIRIIPAAGNIARLNGNVYNGDTARIEQSADKVTITFEADSGDSRINSVEPTLTESGVTAGVEYKADNTAEESKPSVIVALYDESGEQLLAADIVSVSESGNMTVNLNADLKSGKTYVIKATIWNWENIKPLTEVYKINISK